ncbi:MAG: tRNA dihydrouridine synthase DusB, partial [Aquiluna sp.]|nr:tRNA dihydrouridine synthase DusB [Aquiluna sp.]
GEFRASLAQVESLQHARDLLGTLDADVAFPGEEAEGPRGRLGSVKSCALPENWLQSRELSDEHRSSLNLAELSVSGG